MIAAVSRYPKTTCVYLGASATSAITIADFIRGMSNKEYFDCIKCGDRLPLEMKSVLDDEDNTCQNCSGCVQYKSKEEMVADLVSGGYTKAAAERMASELFDRAEDD